VQCKTAHSPRSRNTLHFSQERTRFLPVNPQRKPFDIQQNSWHNQGTRLQHIGEVHPEQTLQHHVTNFFLCKPQGSDFLGLCIRFRNAVDHRLDDVAHGRVFVHLFQRAREYTSVTTFNAVQEHRALARSCNTNTTAADTTAQPEQKGILPTSHPRLLASRHARTSTPTGSTNQMHSKFKLEDTRDEVCVGHVPEERGYGNDNHASGIIMPVAVCPRLRPSDRNTRTTRHVLLVLHCTHQQMQLEPALTVHSAGTRRRLGNML
jgi:hypothetical protein